MFMVCEDGVLNGKEKEREMSRETDRERKRVKWVALVQVGLACWY